MSEILTPDEVREILGRMETTAQYFDVKMEDMEAQFPTVLEKARLCRDYLTLWDRNKELEKEREFWQDRARGYPSRSSRNMGGT